MKHTNWTGFKPGYWQDKIDVHNFIQTNFSAYLGDDSFLAGPTDRTKELMQKVTGLFELEQQYGGVLDVDAATVFQILSLLRLRRLARREKLGLAT